VLIWIVMAVGLVVIVAMGYGGRRRYRSHRSGGAGDNPKSHNKGHSKDHHTHDHRGRGR